MSERSDHRSCGCSRSVVRLAGRTRWLPVLLVLAACHAGPVPADPLQWTIGAWHGVRRSADGVDAAMMLRVEPMADGVGQVECLRVEDRSAPYVGFAVRSRAADSGRWMMVYVNSPQRSFARLEGEVSGSRSTWTSLTAAPTRLSQLGFERIDADHWRRTQSVSEDGGQTWRVLFTDELERNRE
jgi:hypothetical protein